MWGIRPRLNYHYNQLVFNEYKNLPNQTDVATCQFNLIPKEKECQNMNYCQTNVYDRRSNVFTAPTQSKDVLILNVKYLLWFSWQSLFLLFSGCTNVWAGVCWDLELRFFSKREVPRPDWPRLRLRATLPTGPDLTRQTEELELWRVRNH